MNEHPPIIAPTPVHCADCDATLPVTELTPGAVPLCFVHKAWRRHFGLLEVPRG